MAKKAASPKISKGKEDKDTKRDKGGIETKEEDNDKSNSEAMKPKCINSEQQKPAKDDGDRGQGSMDADDKENNKKRKHEGEDQAEPAGKSSKSNDGEDQPEDNAISPKENEDDGKPKATKPPIDLTKPIKRARTAYFIFSDERRAEIQAKVSSSREILNHVFVPRFVCWQWSHPYTSFIMLASTPLAQGRRCCSCRSRIRSNLGKFVGGRKRSLSRKGRIRTGTSSTAIGTTQSSWN